VVALSEGRSKAEIRRPKGAEDENENEDEDEKVQAAGGREALTSQPTAIVNNFFAQH